jgi:hypothetical protein
MVFWLHEELEPSSPLPALVSAGYGQLTNSDPKYGTDEGAFGERLGAAFLRQASMRFFADSLLPTLDHEDPRYYREASGDYAARVLHAAEDTPAGLCMLRSSPSLIATIQGSAPSTPQTSLVTWLHLP